MLYRIRPLLVALLACAGLTLAANPGTAAADGAQGGYSMLTADGQVFNFGAAPWCGSSKVITSFQKATDVEITPNGAGYWVLQDTGYVDFFWCSDTLDDDWSAYEHNNFFGDKLTGGEKAVSMSPLPDGTGYWVFTTKGRAIPFGQAKWHGDVANVALNGLVLDSVATPSGLGYWMVGSDGGIFSFGDAKFSGSTGNMKLNKPVMSMAPDADGTGYWLVASDGGIFAFDAPFYGSAGNIKLNKPISGMVAQPGGYLMVAEDGGIFAYGATEFYGSLGARPPASPVVAVASFDRAPRSTPTSQVQPTPDPQPTPAPQPTPQPQPTPSPEEGTFGDGTFRVGSDIQPGTYRTTGSTTNCYWARLSGFSGEFEDIKANDIGSGPRVVTILPSDVGFESSRCGTWTNDLVPMTATRTSFGEGVFITDLDFTPGTYRTTGSTANCYWARLSGFSGEFEDIKANDIGDGIRTVAVQASDAGIVSSRCGNWTRISS